MGHTHPRFYGRVVELGNATKAGVAVDYRESTARFREGLTDNGMSHRAFAINHVIMLAVRVSLRSVLLQALSMEE